MNMYHVTSDKNVKKILKEGLKINQSYNLTLEGRVFNESYGLNPIYLSTKKDKRFFNYLKNIKNPVVLKVDVKELPLVADLPALVNFGGYYDLEDGIFWWKENEEPKILRKWLDQEGEILIDYLLAPGTETTEAAIKLTGSAACVINIPPEKIIIDLDFKKKGSTTK